MNRRTFNAMSLAAIFSQLPHLTLAQHAARNVTGYQFASINNGLLTANHDGMARQDVAVDDDTLFQVASCSKTVTALAVLTLVRDGHIDLDTPVNRYLTRWQLPGPRGATVTISELLSHTAGTTVHGFEGYGPNDDLPDILDVLNGSGRANSGAIRARHRLFCQFRYSGGGTMVLQALIEDKAGETFAEYVSKNVLGPVGASKATFAITPTNAFALGSFENGQPVEGGFMRHPESAAAGLWATASDLARIFQAILSSLNRTRHAILPAGLAERMITPVKQQAGLGVFVSPGRMIWHEGRNYGYDSIVAAELSTGQVRAAITNRNGAIDSYAHRLLSQ
ncbi:serine hydrolase domain-containing protein [Octadecabacter sp. 1_MG-2023]|uniref:serine hydrolase domain-containing protein n=1 Tax=unclassified Octadecabacter TaxID=196158 RepID=UPI001C084190|nr:MULTISPECIES: serine hydrolase domain-containing protein [unclassified Octadecabacter]MBU2994333.1 beta-lactamase family protein [Octadecabacter sp. B2R22]MDO6734378.1 serine hydrolase domain-containing protein [Octadecabacter sp. 1_MG-2023]